MKKTSLLYLEELKYFNVPESYHVLKHLPQSTAFRRINYYLELGLINECHEKYIGSNGGPKSSFYSLTSKGTMLLSILFTREKK